MELIEEFRQYLTKEGVSANTRKNYVSDLSTFVDFLKIQDQYFSILTLPFLLNSSTLNAYKNWLAKKSPLTTANRRLSSLRKFITYAIQSDSVSRDYTGVVSNFPILLPEGKVQTLQSFDDFLKTHVSDSNQINQYTSDIKSYLLSTAVSSEPTIPLKLQPYSIKRFWQWKNTSTPAALPFKQSSHRTTFFLIGTGVLFIFIALVLTALTLINGRSRALQNLEFLPTFFEKITVSFIPFPKVQESVPTRASELTGPTNAETPTRIRRAWSIFKSWFLPPPLIDPTIE